MKLYWIDVLYGKACAFDVGNHLIKGKILVEAQDIAQAKRKADVMYDNFSLNKIFNYSSFKRELERK